MGRTILALQNQSSFQKFLLTKLCKVILTFLLSHFFVDRSNHDQIIRTLTVKYGTQQKNKRSSVLNLPKQRQVCPSLFFQFNMRISVIYGTLSVSCKRVVSVPSPLASNSCGGSHLKHSLGTELQLIHFNGSYYWCWYLQH